MEFVTFLQLFGWQQQTGRVKTNSCGISHSSILSKKEIYLFIVSQQVGGGQHSIQNTM